MTFDAILELHGTSATGIEVPAAVIEALGDAKRPKVTVSINGHTYRSTVAPMGGRYLLPVAAQERDAAGIAAGDRVSVTLALDDAPRTVEVPEDLARALGAAGRKAFDALSYTQRKECVRSIEEAKKPETRARRIAAAVEQVAG